jgi:beta-glucosidase
LAVPVIRERCPDGQVGIVLNMHAPYPMMDSSADRALARLEHAKSNRWFLDPVMGRGYPQDAWNAYGAECIQMQPDDMKVIAAPIDFLGLNYYSRNVYHDATGGENHFVMTRRDPAHVTARDWEIHPDGLYDLLTWLTRDYAFENIYISENGAAYDDVLTAQGSVHDPLRIQYLREHLQAALRAIHAGVPLRGYFCWTLTDNFEWAFGTSSRFGLAYTDFAMQRRIIKDSGRWFGRVTRANALVE